MLDPSRIDLEEIANALADQTGNSLIDDVAADRFLAGHPDSRLP